MATDNCAEFEVSKELTKVLGEYNQIRKQSENSEIMFIPQKISEKRMSTPMIQYATEVIYRSVKIAPKSLKSLVGRTMSKHFKGFLFGKKL